MLQGSDFGNFCYTGAEPEGAVRVSKPHSAAQRHWAEKPACETPDALAANDRIGFPRV